MDNLPEIVSKDEAIKAVQFGFIVGIIIGSVLIAILLLATR